MRWPVLVNISMTGVSCCKPKTRASPSLPKSFTAAAASKAACCARSARPAACTSSASRTPHRSRHCWRCSGIPARSRPCASAPTTSSAKTAYRRLFLPHFCAAAPSPTPKKATIWSFCPPGITSPSSWKPCLPSIIFTPTARCARVPTPCTSRPPTILRIF